MIPPDVAAWAFPILMAAALLAVVLLTDPTEPPKGA